MKEIAIVTGASSGLGRAFALRLELEYNLDEIWLCARRSEGLETTKNQLQKAKGIVIPMDLAQASDLERLGKRLESEAPRVRVLVNAAGYGRDALFSEVGLEEHLHMIDVNVKALVALTHLCLPRMDNGAQIYQVASVNAFMPLPGGAVYGASKSFVLNFSHALKRELEPRGIHVMTVSPGAVDTEFFGVISGGKKTVPKGAADPADVVARAVADARRGRLNSTHGAAQRFNILLSRLLSRKTLLRLVGNG